MSNTIYLYLKTHNQTGLKYLGKTEKDPYEYKGSGKHWLRHINKHGYDVTTEILYETNDIEDFKKVAIQYSDKWNIVESNQFANLMPEYGTGGNNAMNFTEESRSKMGTRGKNWKLDDTAKENHRESAKNMWSGDTGNKLREQRYVGSMKEFTDNLYGPPCPGWIRNNRIKVTCPHCGKQGDNRNMKRWHFENCRNK